MIRDVLDRVEVTEADGVVRIRLNGGPAGTVLDLATVAELTRAVEGAAERSARVLVLSGAGDSFCLGADRREMKNVVRVQGADSTAQRVSDTASRLCRAIEQFPGVTIAHLHGKVIGAGLVLALCCDLRVAHELSTCRLPELALNFPVAWGGALPRLLAELGPSTVKELVLLGREMSAPEAVGRNVLHFQGTADEAEKVVNGAIARCSRYSPSAVAEFKRHVDACRRGLSPEGSLALEKQALVNRFHTMPQGAKMYEYLSNLLKNRFDLEAETKPGLTFEELDVDSLTRAELGAYLEDNLGATIDDRAITGDTTIEDLAALLTAAGVAAP
ncbi:enoyl-CoA hydratase-related protein [Nocardia sp. NRRL S-836]|uniref:enoyl-CoA hydratase-related protein n=1 Tax=Nocardia sp. NRRL S-836 TaxID=1519492 RepID=UPI0006B0567B|nr:enoyl-CoA hydratase-related protein [Nocardia sp. NRRL S-836]